MRPLLILLIISPIFSWALKENIWKWTEQVQGFLSNPYRKSRVPQFILDTQHPWIIENQKRLEQLPNVESYLCFSPQGVMSDGNRISSVAANGFEIPPDLFDHLKIDNTGFVNRPGWLNALMRAQEINRCPAALSQVKAFRTHVYVYDSEYSDKAMKMLELSHPPRELLDLFVDVLGNMTNLESLEWRIPPPYVHYFEERFVDSRLVLPSVRTLETSGRSHFLVPMCSGITKLDYAGRQTWESYGGIMEDPEPLLLRATMFAPNLTQLGITARSKGWWKSGVQELVSYMPGLKSLSLRGELRSEYRYSNYGNYGDSDGSTLRETLQILGSLQNLTQLDLPAAYELDLNWDGGPDCGNAYFGPGGRDYERQVYREELETVEKAASIVVEVLPHLADFSIDGRQANLTRYENGTVRASFPWTGRLDEWVMEVLPGGPDGPDW
ncbi:hypothetical protein F5Y03DRAFT_352971 [Xylaria venustula]|nr:hypothetical protein F5Y03DRAFT_352971 [Xylaria venustula]